MNGTFPEIMLDSLCLKYQYHQVYLFIKIMVWSTFHNSYVILGCVYCITTCTYAISAYHQHYVIKCVNDLRKVGGFLRVLHQYNRQPRYD